jgi:hypothetical protein
VVALESRALSARRAQFIAEHAKAIREIEHDENRVIPAAEAKYGVTFR